MRTHRSYSKEFIQEAIRFTRESGKETRDAAAELGIPQATLRGWIYGKRASSDAAPNARPKSRASTREKDAKTIERLREEIRQLKRAVDVLLQEHDVLRRAIQVFSGNRTDSSPTH